MLNSGPRAEIHPFYENGGRPVAMSHAGDTSTGAHSGSLAAYRAAAAQGFRWFQVDVVRIGGGELVSGHTVTGRNRSWERKDLAAVRVDAPYVATVRELIDSLPAARWNIEIKSAFAAKALIALLDDLPDLDHIAISSPFRGDLLHRLRRRYGTDLCSAASLLDGGLIGLPLLPGARRRADAVQVFWPLAVSRRVMAFNARRQIQFQTWTVNDADRMRRLLDRGAAGIISDDHQALVEVFRERGYWTEAP